VLLMKKIPLSKGRYALVDDEDYDFLMQWKWYLSTGGYAVRNETVLGIDGKTQTTVRMHRVVNNTPEEMQTDHIDGDKLDNRKANLRSITNEDNCKNQGKISHRKTSSKYKGVCWSKKTNKWYAYIASNGIRKHIGSYSSECEAAKAYNDYAKMVNGEFARLNVV